MRETKAVATISLQGLAAIFIAALKTSRIIEFSTKIPTIKSNKTNNLSSCSSYSYSDNELKIIDA